MDGADPRAGQHGDGGFGDHRLVDGDAVALPAAKRGEGIGKTADRFVQPGLGERSHRFVGAVGLAQDGWLVGAGFQVAIDAVVGDVQFAVGEPGDAEVGFVERGTGELFPGGRPIEAGGFAAPEAFGAFEVFAVKLGVELGVAAGVELCAGGPFGGHRVDGGHVGPPDGLLGADAAIDIQFRAGDELGFVGAEVDRGPGDIVGIADAACRDLAAELCHHLVFRETG